jgi:hypothetical protein
MWGDISEWLELVNAVHMAEGIPKASINGSKSRVLYVCQSETSANVNPLEICNHN